MRLAAAAAVPVVDLRLQLVALLQQGAVLGGKLAQQRGIAGPEVVRGDAAGQQFRFDQLGQGGCHLQACALNVIGHPGPSF